MKPGDRVRFSVDFLRSTGQYTGPWAPTHYGPFARGQVVSALTPTLIQVEWEDGETVPAHIGNLETIVK